MHMDFKQMGMEKATEQMTMLANLNAQITGCKWLAHMRNEGKLTNAQVVDYLAEGGRDITANDDDAERAGRAFVLEVEKQLRLIARRNAKLTGSKQTKKEIAAAQKRGILKANQAAAKAYRAAAVYIAKQLKDRVEEQTTNTGQAADKVDPKYATQRANKYGIPEDVVYKATGQLLENLADRGALKFVRE